ncbi:MAG: hypothetical protein LBU72_08545 [Burkholderiaceae bacterium]|jgi:hypothetical protein|nr:hypothetical protein [Burkholderiaceae bacterium]
MTNQKISAIVIAALAACGILVWALAQAQQSKRAQLAHTVAAASPSAVTVNAAAVPSAPPVAAPANIAAAAPALQRCECDCTPPVRPKQHAKLKKKVRRVPVPEPPVAPVAVAPLPPPVYSPPVVVTPPPVVVGSVVPAYYGYGYGAYPVGSFSYYSGYGGRYWANSGSRFMRGGPGVRGGAHGGYGYRR